MNYFDTKNKKDCNGCGVCALKCPKKAITMQYDNEGFLYPIINKNKCISCDLCKKICPNVDYKKNTDNKCYIAINKNKSELMNSSSGGCFLPIAKYIISKDGYVFGAVYDKNLNVHHEYANKTSDLKQFQGSKYVRSNLKNSFEKIKEFLEEGKYILFSGTPCQCQGLRTYLGKNYTNLYTCEVICHANPSPKVFKYYKKNLESKKNKKIINIQFRAKKNGWKNQKTIIIYEDMSEEQENSFYYGFVRELFNRPSCHNCHFCSTNRLSDFTIGDAWGIEKLNSDIIDNDTGISLLCINTRKGHELKKYLDDVLNLTEVNTKKAFNYNHHRNVPKHINREKFFKGISNGIINESNIIEYITKYTNLSLSERVLNKLIKLINWI